MNEMINKKKKVRFQMNKKKTRSAEINFSFQDTELIDNGYRIFS